MTGCGLAVSESLPLIPAENRSPAGKKRQCSAAARRREQQAAKAALPQGILLSGSLLLISRGALPVGALLLLMFNFIIEIPAENWYNQHCAQSVLNTPGRYKDASVHRICQSAPGKTAPDIGLDKRFQRGQGLTSMTIQGRSTLTALPPTARCPSATTLPRSRRALHELEGDRSPASSSRPSWKPRGSWPPADCPRPPADFSMSPLPTAGPRQWRPPSNSVRAKTGKPGDPLNQKQLPRQNAGRPVGDRQ